MSKEEGKWLHDFAYSPSTIGDAGIVGFFTFDEQKSVEEQPTLREAVNQVRAILKLLSTATAEERAELVHQLERFKTFDLPLTDPEAKLIYSPIIRWEKVRQHVEQQLTNEGFSPDRRYVTDGTDYKGLVEKKEKNSPAFFEEIQTTPEEFERIGILLEAFKYKQDAQYAQEHEMKAKQAADIHEKAHELYSVVHFLKMVLKTVQPLSRLPEVGAIAEKITDKLKLMHREYAWWLVRAIKDSPEKYDRGDIKNLRESIARSDQGVEWFQISPDDLNQWERTLAPSMAERLEALTSTIHDMAHPSLTRRIINRLFGKKEEKRK